MTLKIYLLGQFKLQADSLPIELPSRPAQSLLAYLVLNSGVAQRREKLASLQWPDTTESNARSYLRQALWRIRKALESGSLAAESYLQISDISVTFDIQSDYWLDTDCFLKKEYQQPIDALIETVRLYRGELLPGFYDPWVILERDRVQAAFQQRMDLLLNCLIEAGRWNDALEWAEEWIRLDYSPEPAFRALMSAYAGLGNQGMVRSSFRRCVEALKNDFDLSPAQETEELFERLVSEKRAPATQPGVKLDSTHPYQPVERRPTFFDDNGRDPVDKPLFVARERELSQLKKHLDLVLSGQGRVVFITGEAGSGKTMIMQEFTRQAQEGYSDLIVASGDCNAHSGVGDPYLPLREILDLLSGNVEARWSAGAMTEEHANRLWNTLPLTAKALLDEGEDLIDTFVSGRELYERGSNHFPGGTGWLAQLERFNANQLTLTHTRSLQQSDIFKQYTAVLRTLARDHPLVLLIDDLQWADQGSISLLFHLGRQLKGCRILIIGAYRPEEIALGYAGERHFLEPVIHEFQRLYGEIMVNVDQAERRAFIDAILNSEPNRLGRPFQEMLFRQTKGNPLFTVELLRGMQERGDLVQDSEGVWVEGATFDWETLPARVEAVIAERIGRLAKPLQSLLKVASVEGETFTSEAIARTLEIDGREILQSLSDDLDKKHRLIRAQSIQRIDGKLVSRYRFRHILYQKYLYNRLDEVERAYLHERIGTTLEELYVTDTEIRTIAPQLARHFQEARIDRKAVHYLFLSGERSLQLSAFGEARTHLYQALALLMKLPDSPERARKELDLQLALGMAWMGTTSPEMEKAFVRARDLGRELGMLDHVCRAVGGLSILHFVRAEHRKALQYGEEALSLAQQIGDPLLVMLGHWHNGYVLFHLGEFTNARGHLAQVIASYDPAEHHRVFIDIRGTDAGPSALAYDSLCLWCLGYPEQSSQRAQEAMRLARELDHSFTLMDVTCYALCMYASFQRDWKALLDNSNIMLSLTHERDLLSWTRMANCFQGEAKAMLGQIEEGIDQILIGIAEKQETDESISLVGKFGALADAYIIAGKTDQAEAALLEAFDLMENNEERLYETEIYRLQASLQISRGDDSDAQTSLEKSIQAARSKNAKSLELRGTIDLAHLLSRHGQVIEARRRLKAVFDWFTEGFDTPDLLAAKVLLEELDQLTG